MTIQTSDNQPSTASLGETFRSLLARLNFARQPKVPRLKSEQMSDYQLRDVGLNRLDLNSSSPRRVDLFDPNGWR